MDSEVNASGRTQMQVVAQKWMWLQTECDKCGKAVNPYLSQLHWQIVWNRETFAFD